MKKQQKKKTLISDTVFKYFFKKEEYRNWFLEIIKGKIGIDLTDYTLIDNESNTGNKKKDYRMDLVLEKGDTKVIIEANATNENGISDIKAYLYLYRMEGNSLEEGETYKRKYTKLIMFNNFRNESIPDLKIANLKLRDSKEAYEKEDIESYEFYLPNFHQVSYNEIEDEIDKRLWILGIKDRKELKEMELTDKNLKIIEEYQKLIEEDANYSLLYNAKRIEEKTKNTISYYEGLKEGKEEGAKQKAIETAKNLLSAGLAADFVAKNTGLSLKEVEKLKDIK